MSSQARIETILGMRGSGKSFLTKRLLANHPRAIIFDRLAEHRDASHVVNNLDEFKGIWRQAFLLPRFKIVVKFPFACAEDETQEITARIVELVYKTGIESQQYTTLVFEEAQFYFPNYKLHPVLFELLTTGRHAYLNIIANTQRPASISKLLISQSQVLYIGQLYEMRDIAYLYDTVGEMVEICRSFSQGDFLRFEIGAEPLIIRR